MITIHSPEQLGQALRAARKQLGLTQPQLALAAGVGVRLIVELEAGKPTLQLEKVLRQMIAASSGFYITAAEVAAVLQNEMRKVSALPPAVDLSGTLEDIERRVIEQVLREENMNQSAAAKRLGIGRSTLWRKIAGSGGK